MNQEIYVKGYGFLSFSKNMGKGLSNKFGQKLLDSANKSTTDAIKTASKTAIQKTAEATRDLVGSKIADRITIVSTELHSKKKPGKELNNNEYETENVEIATPKKRYILQKKENKLLKKLRLVPKKYV